MTKCHVTPGQSLPHGEMQTPLSQELLRSARHLPGTISPYAHKIPYEYPHFLMENPRHAEVKSFAQDLGAGKRQNQELNPRCLAPFHAVLRS